MITFLQAIQGLIAFILLGEIKQVNMLLSKQVNLMRVVSNLLGINMNACLIKIRKQLGSKGTQLQAQTSSFGKSLRLILGTAELFLNVNTQVLTLISVFINQEAVIVMRSLRKCVYRLTTTGQKINLIGSSQEAVMRKVSQLAMCRVNPTMSMTSIIFRSNSIQNCKKLKNVQSIEFNQSM